MILWLALALGVESRSQHVKMVNGIDKILANSISSKDPQFKTIQIDLIRTIVDHLLFVL